MNNDLINREDLIKALQAKDLITWTHEYGDAIPVDWLMSVINNIDGISRPQGEWIDYDNTFYKCPNCGYLLEKCCPQCQHKVILPNGGSNNE